MLFSTMLVQSVLASLCIILQDNIYTLLQATLTGWFDWNEWLFNSNDMMVMMRIMTMGTVKPLSYLISPHLTWSTSQHALRTLKGSTYSLQTMSQKLNNDNYFFKHFWSSKLLSIKWPRVFQGILKGN